MSHVHGVEKVAFADTMAKIERLSVDKPWIKINIIACVKAGLNPAELVRPALEEE
jgi:hypothetical protein